MLMKKRHNSDSFFLSTLIIIVSGFVIKLLGLINKITMTRMLGTSGMRLYILSFPTIMLFVSISGFSLYITISKLVAESVITKRYSQKKILSESFKLSFLISLIVDIIYFSMLKTLVIYFLKDEDLYFPLLTALLLIPLVGISDGLKGYFNGLKNTMTVAMGNLSEQVARIFFSIALLFITLPYGNVAATTSTLLALSLGELVAIIYCLIKLKKNPPIDFPNTSGELKAILNISIPNTLSRILGNFTYFLEPIIYTCILSYLGYDVLTIHTEYTIIDAYSIPLLTFISFLPVAIASSIVPGLTQAVVKKQSKAINYYIKKVILFSIVPSILLACNLFFYAKDYMNFIYKTTQGTKWVKYFTFVFICYYTHIPIISILQTIGKQTYVFWTSTIINFSRLLLIVILAFTSDNPLDSVIIATVIAMVLGFIIHIIHLFKITKYRTSVTNIINLGCISVLTFGICFILNHFNVNFLIVLCISSVVYFTLCILFKLIWIESLFAFVKKHLKLANK